MPVYAYRCGNCGHEFEREQSYSDSALKTCPNCKKKTLKRVIGAVGVVFKGSGFYATDHKSSSVSRAGKKDEAASSESKPEGKTGEGKSESTSETKSETKSESKVETKPEKKSESKSE